MFKKSNRIIYKYIYYPELLMNDIIAILINKKKFFKRTLTYREWGDYFTIIENVLGYGDHIQIVKEKRLECNEYYYEYCLSDEYKKKDFSFQSVLDTIKKKWYMFQI